ncbi:MAG: anaerobic sulfatase maturase [Oscillospiraceae bacterium]|nr:anaerobic sulfatase maturase [Oscillospiraceae bacterium]
MPSLSILIKPASGSCNLRCGYCFYHSVAESREIENYGAMPPGTLETLVKKALDYADGSCVFAFQGGEPTLAGLAFYEKLIEYQKKYNYKKIEINNAVQTNGILIDEKWAEFFARNNFLVGLSVDGIKKIHDQNRFAAGGAATFGKVMETARIFNEAGVQYNILSVVTKDSYKYAEQSYHFFKKNCTRYLQFIPCLDPLGEERGHNAWSLTPAGYLKFLKIIFGLWHKDLKSGNPVSVRWFDNILNMVMGGPPEACGMSGVCGCQFVTEADGSVYPCDFYVTDGWKIGNILENGFGEMRDSPVCAGFIKESLSLHPDCRVCEWFALCRGGCKREREPSNDGKGAKNYFCECYREFFKFSAPKLQKINFHPQIGG